jgi:hypothetical protein
VPPDANFLYRPGHGVKRHPRQRTSPKAANIVHTDGVISPTAGGISQDYGSPSVASAPATWAAGDLLGAPECLANVASDHPSAFLVCAPVFGAPRRKLSLSPWAWRKKASISDINFLYRPGHGVKRHPFQISSIPSPGLGLAMSRHLGSSVVLESDRIPPWRRWCTTMRTM